MEKLTRALVSLSLVLVTMMSVAAQPAGAQEVKRQAAAQSVEFAATTVAGGSVRIITSETAGTIEIKLRSGAAEERAFKFTATELSALVAAWRDKQEVVGATAATLARLKEFRAAATEGVDQQALDELTRQIGASEVMAGGNARAGMNGVTFVRAAAGGGGASAVNSPCYDLALLDYQICTAQGGGGLGCMLEALSTLLVCGIWF